MPIKVPDNLPAKEILQNENIFVMDESRAYAQDIRPLKIAILNLMPNKQTTEVQLMRLIGNSPVQVEATLLHMESHKSKNTSTEYLENFYYVFDEIKEQRFDGMIITGAPIEHMEFEDVTYWQELKQIMDWTTTNVTSTFHICWGAQAGLYHHYGIQKYPIAEKVFGIFSHIRRSQKVNLLRGFDEYFFAPHSRYTEVRSEDIEKISDLEILSDSPEVGVYIVASKDGKRIFVTGHSEYDPLTLNDEYVRDLKKGEKITMPKNYYENDDPNMPPVVRWRAHANLLYANWLNYYVYQETPYNFII